MQYFFRILKSSVFFGLRTDKLGTGSKPIEPTVFFYRNVSSDLYYDCQRVMDDVITASCTAVVYAGTAYKRLDSYMKFLECTKGVATYGLDPKHVTKNQHGQRKWRPQLRQSMNIKLGGINFQFQFPQLAEKVNFIKNNFVYVNFTVKSNSDFLVFQNTEKECFLGLRSLRYLHNYQPLE